MIISEQFQISGAHPCLPGHFPGHPIVPAVVLLEEVAKTLRARLGPDHGEILVSSINAAKFSTPVLPDQLVNLHIDADTNTGRARFRCEVDGKKATQGEIGFRAAAHAG